MSRKSLPGVYVLLMVLMILGLAACTGEATPSGGVAIVTPPASSTATSEPTTAATSPQPATDTPGPTETADTPSPVAASATPTPTMPQEPTSEPSPEAPTETPTQAPTGTPAQAPTETPTPTSSPAPTVQQKPDVDLAQIRLGLQKIAAGLDVPVGLASAGDGSGRLFIVEKPGRIRILQDGALLKTPFVDLTDRVGAEQSEQGLLGLAFHPQYANNGLFYVNYTDRQGDTVVARYSVTADSDRGDPGSESILLTLDQPAGNHNGGHLAFGPDGYLYIGTGDGGAAADKYGNGQNGQTLLGAMLRLDVDQGQPYAIPAGNPFVGDAAVRDEIWALGLRNPWRYSFDRLTGDLYIADVGQNRYEESNVQPAGAPGGQNYGWPIMEGANCFPVDQSCDKTGLTLPVAEYEHAQGCSVTGGYVYRGQESAALKGVYLFGDYCSGRIWGLAPATPGGWQVAELAQSELRISSFGQDESGELYVLGMDRGELYKMTTLGP